MRRHLRQLERAVADARSNSARAMALYRLAVFHDNNRREAAAVPLYRRALALGLDDATRCRALAWLASSLHKTGRRAAALRCVRLAIAGECPEDLRGLLLRLQKRSKRSAGSDRK